MDGSLIQSIVQGGAIAILAWHFLVSLPAILERISREQAAERLFWADQAQKDREEFARRAEMIAAELRRSNEMATTETKAAARLLAEATLRAQRHDNINGG